MIKIGLNINGLILDFSSVRNFGFKAEDNALEQEIAIASKKVTDLISISLYSVPDGLNLSPIEKLLILYGPPLSDQLIILRPLLLGK